MSQPAGFRLLAIASNGTVPEVAIPSDLAPIIEATKTLYAEIGHEPPWISYVATSDGVAVGSGAFVGAPKDGSVEIAYFTREGSRRQGFATSTARVLIEIAKRADPAISIWAKTSPEPSSSTRILELNGFRRTGLTLDHEIGDAWVWTRGG